jgi:predicted  nucleic acid-binding Zn-ribbon protein
VAATLTDSNELTYFSFAIEKTEATPDGDLYVYGKATDETLDSDEQIIDKEFSSKAIADWLSTGANVRVQHNAQRDPAGVGVEASTDREGATWVKSLVVEPVAKRLVEKGALRAYSVGIARPKIVRDNVARGGRIVGGEIVEISLVDRPANKSCGIQLVKAADDGSPEWVGKVFGADILAKAETVNVDVPKSASITFSPTDLAKLLEHRRVAEERADKRDMDPAVGGGVDRDKIPAEDFAGANRSFPIVTPKDVHDAAESLGRAKGQDTEKIKRRIISIAQRKGDAYVAQLPDAWKTEDPDLAKGKKAKKAKPFSGAAPAFDGQDSDGDGKDTDQPGSEQDDDEKKPPKVKPGSSKKGGAVDEPEVEKAGAKKCPKCGKNFHADSKLRNCDSCGADLPHAEKGAGVHIDLTGSHMLSESDMDRLVEKLAAQLAGRAALKADAPQPADPDEADDADEGDADVGKAGKPTPDGGAAGAGAAGMEPVPAHREPDGTAIESLEHDAHLPTTPDSSVKAAMRLKSLGVPGDMGALHDMLCPGYHPAEAAKCYPGFSLEGLRVEDWQAKALTAATSAPLGEATAATALWQHAVTIKGTEPEILGEIRTEAHKAFRDANPGPGTFPTPTELSATRYRRAFISAGHANPGTGHDGPNTHEVPSGGVSANQFGRDYLATGHAENSPSNKGETTPAPVPAPVPTGEPNRVYYRNTQRETAKAAMQAMHDHIAQTFPDLCPMTGSGSGGAAPVGQHPVPVPVGKADKPKKAKKANKGADLTKGAVAPDAFKAAVAEATAPLFAQLEEISKALRAEQGRTEELQKAVNALGDLPDPATAAFKGVAQSPLAKSQRPVGAATIAEIAERNQQAVVRELHMQARTNPDPAQREAAWSEYYRMTGVLPR